MPDKQGRGIVTGQGDEYRVRASQFDLSATIAENDVLETSGAQRSTFPRGIPVGTITSVSTDDATQQKTADVRLLANLSDLNYVTVLRYTPKPD